MNAPIVVTQTYSAPLERVWRAITDPDQMRQWFFEGIETFRAEPGFETRFNVVAEGRDYLHLWRITGAVANQSIVYDWRYAGRPGQSVVEWKLSTEGAQTRLELTHTGMETFPQDEKVFTHDSCRGGWEYFLGQRLTAYLKAQPAQS